MGRVGCLALSGTDLGQAHSANSEESFALRVSAGTLGRMEFTVVSWTRSLCEGGATEAP